MGTMMRKSFFKLILLAGIACTASGALAQSAIEGRVDRLERDRLLLHAVAHGLSPVIANAVFREVKERQAQASFPGCLSEVFTLFRGFGQGPSETPPCLLLRRLPSWRHSAHPRR